VRIIGGLHRGRKLRHTGDERTRPMKHRVREAVFNLIQDDIKGRHAIDLFAGSGALGLEALSRGAAAATLIELHHPTAREIQGSAEDIGLGGQTTVVTGDIFRWIERAEIAADRPWLIFCSPPWELFQSRAADMQRLIGHFVAHSPPDSTLVVEANTAFDPETLPHPEAWFARDYPPARILIWRKEE
jgi:16S rRNA (guanine966-N2)-methyltransferase